MSATSPAQFSYDISASDGPAGAGNERMPDGAPLVWSRPAPPGPYVAADPRIDALEVVAPALRGAGPGRGGSAAASALIEASSLALADRKLGRLFNPGLRGHRLANGRNVTGNRNHGPFGRKILKHLRHVTVVADWSRR